MLRWKMIFIVNALVTSLLAYGGVVGAIGYTAKILFFVFIALFVISIIVEKTRT